MNLTLFLGAGVSRSSGFPLVDGMTDLVLGRSGETPGALEREVQTFLQILHEQQWTFLKKRVGFGSKPTYEHLYQLCDQIESCMAGRSEDASIGPFVQKFEDGIVLSPIIERAWEASNEMIRDNPFVEERDKRERGPLEWIAGQGKKLIQRAVVRELSRVPDRVEGLDLLRSLLHSETVDRLFVVTLNHDLLIERVLAEEGVEAYADGFTDQDGDLILFNPDAFDEPVTRTEIGPSVSLIKLHGSIDWRLVGEQWGTTVARQVSGIPGDPVDGSGSAVLTMPDPIFLTGGRKEVNYFGGVFPTMHRAFRDALDTSDVVVESGFSWNDLALSYQLISWSEVGERSRVILLHRDDVHLGVRSQGINRQRLDALTEEKNFVLVNKWFSEAELSDLEPFLSV